LSETGHKLFAAGAQNALFALLAIYSRIVFTEKLHFFDLMNPEDLKHRFDPLF
jgi:3-oxoacyl-(acyl-carrier-protein) synthase